MIQQQTVRKILTVPVSVAEKDVDVIFRNGPRTLPLKMPVSTRGKADFIAGYPVPFESGTTVEIEAPELFFDQAGWQDSPDPLPSPSEDPARQLLHYSPQRGWLNDPNGLFFLDGIWHLFHQYYPFGPKWGSMHWKYAVSTDLLHWEEREITLYPDDFGMMFSGCAVIDQENVSGLRRTPETPPVLLFYTATGTTCTQCLAFSTDGGRHFEKYPRNPVVPNLFGGGERDPAVRFDPDSGKWIMALYLGDEGAKDFILLESENLLDWRKTDRFSIPGGRECPNFLRMRDEADGKCKWVFFEANNLYCVGELRKGKFHFSAPPRAFCPSAKRFCYAGQTFANTPEGKVVFLGWQRNPFSDGKLFSQSLTFPLEFRLRDSELLTAPYRLPRTLEEIVPGKVSGLPFVLEFRTGSPFAELSLGEDTVEFNFRRHEIRMGGKSLPMTEHRTCFEGKLVVDTVSMELFDAEGRIYSALACRCDPRRKLRTEGLERLECRRMESIYSSSGSPETFYRINA